VFNGVDCDQIGIFLLLCRIFPCENILSVSIFVPKKERAVLVVWSAARLGSGSINLLKYCNYEKGILVIGIYDVAIPGFCTGGGAAGG
jgi:hypothetical protein